MKAVPFANVVASFENSPSGGFVSVKGYESEKGDRMNVLGHLGFNYSKAKRVGVDALKKALLEKNFQGLDVVGTCRSEGGVFNARKRSWDIAPYSVYFTADEVTEMAENILWDWENPKPRTSNKISLTSKGSGLGYNTETGNFSFSLLVDRVEYLGATKPPKPENTAPESKLKAIIRNRFQRSLKTYTIGAEKFQSVVLGGNTYTAETITF